MFAALLSGCATVNSDPVPTAAAMNVPPERILAPTAEGANAQLVFVRDISMIAANCYWGLFVDGKLAARIGNMEKVALPVKAGEFAVSTARDPQGRGLCGGVLGSQEVVRTARVEPGETRVYRLMMMASGGMEIVRADN
jgi:hypothetical protein